MIPTYSGSHVYFKKVMLMLRQIRGRLLNRTRVNIFLLIFLAAVALALTIVARPVFHLAQTAWGDRNEILPPPSGLIDDASRLNQTAMGIVQISSDFNESLIQLRSTLKKAQSQGNQVSISASRHSMGGQSLYPNGILLDMSQVNPMQVNPATQILTVGAGATWSQIIPYLHERGYSVAVMQSNNDFSVGGTLSANAHGWQHNHPPFASTVESFRLMLADGKVVRCSRQENAELFSLVLGGYGLFGIILDVNLEVVPNELYVAQRTILASQDYAKTYQQQVSAEVGMAYGRLSIAPDSFLKEAILTTYHKAKPNPPDQRLSLASPSDASPSKNKLTRTVFRGSVGSDYGKKLRWQLEKVSGGEAGSKVSRNQILNRSSTLLENYQQSETDILHEYFVPPQSLEKFLEKCREIIPQHNADLLNVTVRNVYPDEDSFLRYADQEVFGLVMLFHQQRNAAGEANMQALTEALIEAALAVGGRYYLPYRLHATPEQFHRAYPQATQFFRLKRKYDPNTLFQNQFYMKYGK